MANMIPYRPFQGVDRLPQSQGEALPGYVQGVYFTLPTEVHEDLLNKIEGWFEGREDVALVDSGTTDKQGLGYIMIEWHEVEVDPLFLAILRDEELVEDYTVYEMEVEN